MNAARPSRPRSRPDRDGNGYRTGTKTGKFDLTEPELSSRNTCKTEGTRSARGDSQPEGRGFESRPRYFKSAGNRGRRPGARRGEILELLLAERGNLFIPAPVTAEIDYLLGQRFGSPALRAFLEDLRARRYETPGLAGPDYEAAMDLDRRYADLNLGLADLSVVVVAGKLGTRRLLTFDEHHFRAVRLLQGGTFTLLPADA